MHTHARTVAALAVGVALSLTAGCAKSGQQPAKSPTPAEKPTVAFVVPSTDLNFAKEMAAGYAYGVRQVGGVEYTVAGTSRMDNAGEAKILHDILADKKADGGISLFMQAADLFAPLIADAQARNIPIIAVDNKMDTTSKVDLFVGNDNYALGQLLADEVIKQLPADAVGDVVVGTPVPGVPVLEMRAKGIRDEFRKRLPNVNVLGPFDSKQDPLVNLSTWESLVAGNPDALAYLGTGDADAYNLADIRKRTQAKWLAGAFDLDPRSLAAVKSGDLVLVSPEHFVKGAIAGRLQAERAKNGTALPKGWIYTPGLAVTKENVDDITRRQESDAAKEAWFKPKIDAILGNQKEYLRPLGDAR